MIAFDPRFISPRGEEGGVGRGREGISRVGHSATVLVLITCLYRFVEIACHAFVSCDYCVARRSFRLGNTVGTSLSSITSAAVIQMTSIGPLDNNATVGR